MFKSIEYRLCIYLLLLILSVVGATYLLFVQQQYIYGGFCVFMAFVFLFQLSRNYKKFNTNILFLLNAIDNGDYAFNFTETRLSRRERELNAMMNRMKDILSSARQEVIENEKFLSLIIHYVPTGIVILDEHNNVTEANKAVVELLGLPVFTHLNQLSIIDKGFPEMFRNLKAGDEGKQIKIINEREEVQIAINVASIAVKERNLRIITLNSIGSELEANEMESWIKLIRIMTHEIMNSVAPITSLTDMLLYSYKTADEVDAKDLQENTVDALSTINSTAKGLITFVESYREFSRVAHPVLKTLNLTPLIDSLLMLEEAEIVSRGINVTYERGAEALVVNADETQISRVIVNIIKNGIEALAKDGSGNEIKISVGTEEFGNKVFINIANNGNPIPAEILENIFIPFFTTKQNGSGIGLSVSRYIMRLHGGNLKHIYEDGWTIFSLTLPKDAVS